MEKTSKRTFDIELLVILALAFFLRVLAIIFFPGVHHPDETYQVFEQAHRVVFGYGITPWEFEDGIRSMVLPYFVAAPIWLTSLFSDNPFAYVTVTRLVMAALSLIPIIFIYNLDSRFSREQKIVAALVAAVWFENISFSYHPMTETVASLFLVIALCIASRNNLKNSRVALLGGILAFMVGVRLQMAPAAFVIGIFACRENVSRWVWLIVGTILPLAVFGGSDWWNLGYPFASYINYFKINLLQSKASTFGTEGPFWYLQQMYQTWTGALPFIIFFAYYSRKQCAVWFATAIVVILAHSLIPHKEYRFVEPAFLILVLTAAIGSASFLSDLLKTSHIGNIKKLNMSKPFLVLAAAWTLVSGSLAFSDNYYDEWFYSIGYLKTGLYLYHDPDLCGLMVFSHLARTGGYSYLHRHIPIYWDGYLDKSTLNYKRAFNVVIVTESNASVFEPEFHREICYPRKDDNVCVLKRAGTCEAIPGYLPIEQQKRFGEILPPRPSK